MSHVAKLVLAAGIALAPGALHAQDVWPSRTITFIVPYASGGYTDLVGRLTARYVEKALGKPVIVESRPGAGGIVGTQAVASAAPDGYTFCVCSVGAVSIALFAQKVGYDPLRDLAPVGIVSSIVQAVIVKKDLPAKSMAEFVSYAKANPGKLNYGSSGAGGLTHYSVELFQVRTGTKAVHIPFKGSAPATAAVVAGEVDFAFANMTDALPQIEAGYGPRPRGDVARTQLLSPRSALGKRDGRPRLHCGDLERDHRPAQDPGGDHAQDVRNPDQDGGRSGGERSHAQAGASTVKSRPSSTLRRSSRKWRSGSR